MQDIGFPKYDPAFCSAIITAHHHDLYVHVCVCVWISLSCRVEPSWYDVGTAGSVIVGGGSLTEAPKTFDPSDLEGMDYEEKVNIFKARGATDVGGIAKDHSTNAQDPVLPARKIAGATAESHVPPAAVTAVSNAAADSPVVEAAKPPALKHSLSMSKVMISLHGKKSQDHLLHFTRDSVIRTSIF